MTRLVWLATLFAIGCAGKAAVGTDTSGSPTDPGTGPGTTTDPGTTNTDTTTSNPTGTGDCKSWLADYTLDGSVFHAQSSQGDFDITVQEPYDADGNTGPGHVVLRFPDVGGEMGAGTVMFQEYQLTWDFYLGIAGVANVHTDIENQAGPESCGLTAGVLSAKGDLDWDPLAINLCQDGQVSCEGPLCGQFGSPPANQPQVVDNECADWAIHPFKVSPDFQTIVMAPAVVTDEDGTTTAMEFHGTLTDAKLDPTPPACACGG